MSLSKQLWLAIIGLTLLAFCCSFLVSTISARHYLEQQLALKNQDNANALAIAMSQQPLDRTTAELLISAQFDGGHYASIRLVDPNGKLLIEKQNPQIGTRAPAWFADLIPIAAAPGTARIQSGWRQFGSLTLSSHSRFAYDSLWQGTVDLLFWFTLGGLLCGLIGSLLLRTILRPLDGVVEQAEAIGERRFIQLAVPGTKEFRLVTSAMNRLSQRVRTMLEEETGRLDQLRRETQHDPLTGLLTRQQFLNQAEAALTHEDGSGSGSLLIARLERLDELNRTLGRDGADYLLRRIGDQLQQLLEEHPNWFAGRLAGADFALLTPGSEDVLTIARETARRLHLAVDRLSCGEDRLLPVGGTSFAPGESLAKILARGDGALLDAERRGGLAIQIAPEQAHGLDLVDHASWKNLLEEALQSGELKLGRYPVLDSYGTLLHYESPVRLLLGGSWQPAAVFIAWAARLGLMPQLDTLVLKAALAEIHEHGQPLGIHLSSETLQDEQLTAELVAQLKAAPQAASLLWLEAPEYGVFDQLPTFRSLCRELKPLGCKIGLEHVGQQFCRLSELYDLGLDFIKIDAALIRDVDCQVGNQNFLRGLCMIAHSIGLKVIAEGVKSEAELNSLPALGLDGATGPAVTEEG